MKSSNDEILRFIASSFRSVWALELLLVLKSEQRSWSHEELVATMRASELVVTRALAALEAAGLVSNEGDKAQYMPVSDEVARSSAMPTSFIRKSLTPCAALSCRLRPATQRLSLKHSG